MKKILGIIVLGLLLSGNAYAATIGELKKLKKEKLEAAANDSQKLTSEKITNDWLKNKTVNDLRKLNFYFKKEFGVTTTEDSVQYHLYKTFNDPFAGAEVSAKGKAIIQKLIKGENVNPDSSGLSKAKVAVYIICFIDPKKTTCRLS